MPAHDRKVLLVTLGLHRVGKTSLSRRFALDEFDPSQFSTVGALHFEKVIEVDEMRVLVEIWDTAGQEQYESLARQYWQKADGALIVYDMTDPGSFVRAKYWVEMVRRESTKPIVLILVAMKLDLGRKGQRRVNKLDAENFAKENGITHLEASALTGENVDAVFQTMVHAIPIPESLQQVLTINAFDQNEDKSSGGCC